MRIAFCTPLAPIDHPRLSGDVTIARDLRDFLESVGHEVLPVPHLATRNLAITPERWPELLTTRRRTLDLLERERPDLWLTYNTYYRAPDLLGPMAARRGLPYAIFCASYAENRRKNPDTLPGYMLNRRAMLAADHIFINRKADLVTAAKLLEPEKYEFVRPGIRPGDFLHDPEARKRLRRGWQLGDTPLVVCAAMFRAGVKVEGVRHTLEALHRLAQKGREFRLLLIGDGRAAEQVRSMVQATIPERTIMPGQVDRQELAAYFSAGDLFAFPGIEESIGMVYLEAQSTGLPCVAWDDAGAVDVIRDGVGGIITPAYDQPAFDRALDLLLQDAGLRRRMGSAARDYVRSEHDITRTYAHVSHTLEELAAAPSLRAGKTPLRRPDGLHGTVQPAPAARAAERGEK